MSVGVPEAMGAIGNATARSGCETTVMYFIAYPQRMAGANRSLFELVTNLPAHVRPFVVLAGEGRVASAYREAGIPCEIIEPGGLLNSFGRQALAAGPGEKLGTAMYHLPRYTIRLARLIRRRKVDLVHVNDPRGALFMAVAARLARVPLVAHLRGELPFGRRGRRIFERVPDRIVTVSEAVRRELSPSARGKAVTVYNGIRPLPTPERRIPELASLRERGVVVVTCFASIVPFKGVHHLIRAAAILNDRGYQDRVRFICVGDLVSDHSGYQRWLDALMERLGVKNLELVGWQDDPFAYYTHTDIAVLPSVSREELEMDGERVLVLGNEGFPRTHLEAMQFALPIVGTRIAGVPEQIADGETGLIVDPGDVESLADALEKLISSPELRRRMGERGRERVNARFSTRAYVDGVMRVYESLVPARLRGS